MTWILITLITLASSICLGQNQKNMTNPLLCDPETGICEIPEDATSKTDSNRIKSGKKPVKLIYYTDPICSSCWGIDPQLRKLKLEYGNSLDIEYRMGGLLPDWSYNSGGISKPSDVAHHWDEVSLHYDMPIDGDIWLEDPLSSSYPPSIAFKAAQIQDKEKAVVFLREIKEMVFLQKKNITKWEHLEKAVKIAGLDTEQLKSDFNGKAKALFEEDLNLARQLGVRGFPTIFFIDSTGKTEKVYGAKPYSVYESAVLKVAAGSSKHSYTKNWETVFQEYPTLTAREFAELTDTPRRESENLLNELTTKGILNKQNTKNGAIWKLEKQGEK